MVLEGVSDAVPRHPVDVRAMRVQLAVLSTLGMVYLALALFWVPPHNRLLVPIGALAMGGAATAARALGPARRIGNELVIVWLVLAMGILLPTVAGPPSPRGRGFVTAFLGIFCALGLWAVFRYPARQAPRPRRSLAGDLRWGVLWGAGMAAAFSMIALVIAGIAMLAGGEGFPIGWIVAAYWAGGLVAGAVAGLGRPLGRWPLGSMLVGMPAAGAVYGAVMLAMMLVGETGETTAEQMRSPGFILATLLAICCVIGPLGGLAMRGMGDE
jgi:hypothetical protein